MSGYKGTADEALARMKERAKDVVAKIEAEPGWRACIVTANEAQTEMHFIMVPISHWGIVRTCHSFGPFAGAGTLFSMVGGGADSPVPMSADGRVLDAAGFWGLASPSQTDEEMADKFKAEVAGLNARYTKKPEKEQTA